MTDNPAPKPKGRTRGRGGDPGRTKIELMDAAFATLKEEGLGGATTRRIARRANCNQASIYYHFDSLEKLLVRALSRSSDVRLERYETALAGINDPQTVLRTVADLYVEDRASGHLEVLAELLGGVTASPTLREGIAETTEPWMNFVEAKVQETTASLRFGSAFPAGDIADLIFSVVVGVEMRTKLDGHSDRSDRLFQLATLAAGFLPAESGHKETNNGREQDETDQ